LIAGIAGYYVIDGSMLLLGLFVSTLIKN
jgi:hypothetical protein